MITLALAACSGEPAEVPDQLRTMIHTLGAEAPELQDAMAMVEQSCLQDGGLDAPLLLPPDGTGVTPLNGARGLRTVERASADGYGLMQGGEDERSPVEAWLDGLSEADRQTYEHLIDPENSERATVTDPESGIVMSAATSGCTAEARTAVFGSVENALTFTLWDNVLLGLDSAWMEDAGLTERLGRYAECMRAAGYPVSNVREASALAEERFGPARAAGGPLTTEERSMAVTDATCQEDVGLHAAVDEAFLRANAQFFLDHEAQILSLAELRQASLERAKDILAQS